ncbi:hypothetical protein GCM10007913_42470 [Devosia yakushimensis]|uniref:Uncharacterized protein n=1 Tax=Devosia yakushimensis TaxID=470028 RepID=A0ABQ5UKZ8_9HYPH|nr:hypothetical protein GCM10007913_42470 [Devosia yakushimensis]
MIGKALAQIRRFPLQRLARQRDIAQYADDRPEGLDLGKAQDIGRAVLAAPLLVELMLLFVIGEQDRQLRRPLDLGLGMFERLQNSAFGQRIEILRPAFIIADNGNIDRRIGQRLSPSEALSASFLAVSAS